MNENDLLNNPPISNINDKIIKLEDDLNTAQEIIQQLYNQIDELEKEISNKDNIIKSLNNDIKLKDNEIREFISKLNNEYINKKIDREQIMCVYFTSIDQNIQYPIPCIKTDLFKEIEEKLYKQYPEYRETNNFFICNGKQISKFKTIEENEIGNGLPVILYISS